MTLTCSSDPWALLQALRVCEGSTERGGVIACLLRESLGSGMVGPVPTELSFTRPAPRPPDEPGGTFDRFVAGVLAAVPPTRPREVVP